MSYYRLSTNSILQVCLTLYLCFISGATFAQADSLQLQLQHSSEQESIDLYYKLANEFMHIDIDSAAQYLSEGQRIALKTNNGNAIRQGKMIKSRYYLRKNQPYLALEGMLEILSNTPTLSAQDSMQVTDILSTSIRKLGDYQRAVQYRLLHSQLVLQYQHPLDYYYSLENVAYLYSQLKDYEKANLFYDSTASVAENIGSLPMLMHCNNNMGYNYFQQKQWDLSLEKYGKAIEIFEELPQKRESDSLLHAIIHANIGKIYAEKEEYVQAIHYFTQADKDLLYLKNKGNADSLHYGRCLLAYAQLELEQKHYGAVGRELTKIHTNFQRHPKELINLYRLQSEYYDQTQQYKKAAEALRKEIELDQQLISENTDLNNGVYSLLKLQEKKIKKEKQLLSQLIESEEQNNRLRLQLILGGALLAIIILILLFFKYKAQQQAKAKLTIAEKNVVELELKNKALESEKLKEELDYKNKDLTSFAIDITRKNEFIQELLSRLSQVKQVKDKDKEIFELTKFVRSEMSIDNNLKLFQENIQTVNQEFISKLQTQYPNLTVNEQQLCALLRLKLSTKEIATVKNITPESVKVLRHRLRKKMELASDVNLTLFLNEIT